jgi:ribosome-binding protein aMBF1 (putative translation factor)
MIENQRQYNLTKANLERFKITLSNILQQDISKLEVQIQRDAVQSEIEVLTNQLNAFDDLRNGQTQVELGAFEGIAEKLIQARVARGFTQAELAAKLKMKPQQIQRYEASKYASASLARVLEVARVLQNTGK